ncbi:hypothetical protein [Alkalibacterium sp. MB6]|uniref:hypothetical protein n=1 Tax=Alkalibacterium sp. MB6 TaxID=2081965 RepID=UPI001379E559|nr:hypothetical protein [Alkalibacterium sp. MB6]
MMQQYEKMFAARGAKKMYRTNIMHKYWNVVLNALRNINHKNANLSLREKKRQMETVFKLSSHPTHV